jgi:hypothetical protein
MFRPSEVAAKQHQVADAQYGACSLCHSVKHTFNHHDTELLDWIDADQTGARRYYAYKRTEKKDYKGFRADVYWMMNHSEIDW